MNLRHIALLFVWQIILGACFSKIQQSSSSKGYVSSIDERRNLTISVCWQSSSNETEKSRVMVQKVIQDEFAQARINFVGFQECTDDPVDVEIVFTKGENRSRVDSIGRNGRLLYLETEKFLCKDENGHAISYLGSNCFTNVALHEFGHLVGLHHEMNRPDRSSCEDFDQHNRMGELNGNQVGDFDENSIMNYCWVWEANRSNTQLGLSSGDLSTLKELYFGVLANIIISVPHRGPPDKLNFSVSGEGVKSARILFGKSNAIDCHDMSQYRKLSRLTKIDSTLLQDLFNIDNLTMDEYKVCVLGEDEQGNLQEAANYTSFNYFFEILLPKPELFSVTATQKVFDLSTESVIIKVSSSFDSRYDSISLYIEHPEYPMAEISGLGQKTGENTLSFTLSSGNFIANGIHRFKRLEFAAKGRLHHSLLPNDLKVPNSVSNDLFEAINYSFSDMMLSN